MLDAQFGGELECGPHYWGGFVGNARDDSGRQVTLEFQGQGFFGFEAEQEYVIQSGVAVLTTVDKASVELVPGGAVCLQGLESRVHGRVGKEADLDATNDRAGIDTVERGEDFCAILVVEVSSRVESELVGKPGADTGLLPQPRGLDVAAGGTRGSFRARFLQHAATQTSTLLPHALDFFPPLFGKPATCLGLICALQEAEATLGDGKRMSVIGRRLSGGLRRRLVVGLGWLERTLITRGLLLLLQLRIDSE